MVSYRRVNQQSIDVLTFLKGHASWILLLFTAYLYAYGLSYHMGKTSGYGLAQSLIDIAFHEAVYLGGVLLVFQVNHPLLNIFVLLLLCVAIIFIFHTLFLLHVYFFGHVTRYKRWFVSLAACFKQNRMLTMINAVSDQYLKLAVTYSLFFRPIIILIFPTAFILFSFYSGTSEARRQLQQLKTHQKDFGSTLYVDSQSREWRLYILDCGSTVCAAYHYKTDRVMLISKIDFRLFKQL